MFKSIFVVSVASAILLSGCSTIPLTSIPKLMRIDFMTTDLSRMRVAIALPLSLAPKAGGVVMEMKYRVAENPEQQENLLLVQSSALADKVGLPIDATREQAVFVFQLLPKDVERLNALRAKVAAAKQAHEKGSLGLGISAKQFCKVSAPPSGTLLSTTYVLTSETESYVTMAQNFDLRSDPQVAEGLTQLEACK